MHIRAIACSLPNRSYYLVFHSHVEEDKAVWTEKDLQRFLELQQSIKDLYRTKGAGWGLRPRAMTALYDPEVDADEALQRVVPYLIEANRHNKSEIYLHHRQDSVQVRRMAGIHESLPHALRQVVIMKGTKGVMLRPSVDLLSTYQRLARCKLEAKVDGELVPIADYKPGSPLYQDGELLDINSLEFRSSPALTSAARMLRNDNATYKGRIKVVTLPRSVEVYLTANKGGELLKEVARVWA